MSTASGHRLLDDHHALSISIYLTYHNLSGRFMVVFSIIHHNITHHPWSMSAQATNFIKLSAASYNSTMATCSWGYIWGKTIAYKPYDVAELTSITMVNVPRNANLQVAMMLDLDNHGECCQRCVHLQVPPTSLGALGLSERMLRMVPTPRW